MNGQIFKGNYHQSEDSTKELHAHNLRLIGLHLAVERIHEWQFSVSHFRVAPNSLNVAEIQAKTSCGFEISSHVHDSFPCKRKLAIKMFETYKFE